MDSPRSTLCIPLKYTYLSRPVSSGDKQVYFEALPSKFTSVWRDADAAESSGQFAELLDGKQVTDCLVSLRRVIGEINEEDNGVTGRLNEERILENTVTATLTGPADNVTAARAKLLSSYYQVERRHIGIESMVAFPDEKLNQQLCVELDEIAAYCGVAISVTDFIEKIPYGIGYHQELSSESAQKPYHILIYGDQDAVDIAETKTNVALDHINGKFVESLPLPLSIQPLVCGPKIGNLKNIEIQTNTLIYMPGWMPEVFASQSSDQLAPRNLNEIYITGDEANVTLAKQMLKGIIKNTKPIFKDCVIYFAKIELLVLRYQDKIVDIMKRHGSFIQLPYLGAARSLVRVQGSTAASVEKTISELMTLSTDFYNSSYWIHSGKPDEQGHLKQPKIDTDLEFLDKITAASGATIYCTENTSFEIIGYRSDTKRATSMIKSLPIYGDGQYQHQVRFRLELSIEQREFIAGKKNGKIIRIMNNANVWIKFLPFNEYNFYINLTADDYTAAAAGIQLLEDELPSEVSFYIPETYHKQVIGAGGLTIQSIMRKYNVFIKFSNGYDVHPNGFSHTRPDNVLIRCPSKNAKNIPAARQELLETVKERGQDHCNTWIHISRSHRRILLSEKCGFVHEVEAKTNTIILFPEDEPNDIADSDLVEIRGLGNTSEDASRMIKALLPDDYVFKVAYSHKFYDIVNENNPEFYSKIVGPFRIALNIETQVFANPITNHDETSRYHRIVLSFAQEHSVGLEDVIQVLTAFLRDKDLDIIDRGELKVDPVEAGTAAVYGHKRKQSYMENKRYTSPPPSAHGHHGAPPGPPVDYDYRERPGRYERSGSSGGSRTPARSQSRTRYSRPDYDYRPDYRYDYEYGYRYRY